MPKPYGEDSSNNQLSHWIDRAVQAEFRAEKFETALSKEVLAVIQKAAQAAFEPKMIEATWVVSPDEAARLKAKLDDEQKLIQRVDTQRDDIAHLIRRIEKLEAQATSSQAEVERLTGNLKAEQNAGWDMVAENTRLKAEVDRLTKEAAYHEMSYKRVVAENRRLSERIDELEANR